MAVGGLKAQTLHGIVFCNTTDHKIGESVAVDNDRAINEIDEIAGYIGFDAKLYVYSGTDCTKQNLIKVLNELYCKPNDLVIFYYSGHGVHPQGGFDDKFPQMCMNSNFESNFVPVRVVNEMLAKKKPRLRVILTDCCNNINEQVTVKGMTGAKGITVVKSADQINYRKLFADAKGYVMATSSKLGQTSGCATYDDSSEAGGFFSVCFFERLYKDCKSSASPTWNSLLSSTKNETVNMTHSKQEPYFVESVTYGNTPAPSINSNTNPAPTPAPTPSNATNSSFSDAVARLLATSSKDARLKQVPPIIRNCFGGKKAYIVSVGRDLKTEIDTEDAQTFLNRMALSNKTVRVNVIKEEKDASGNFFITIHEMRRE